MEEREYPDSPGDAVDFTFVVVPSDGLEPLNRFGVALHAAFVVHSRFGGIEFGFGFQNPGKGVAKLFENGFLFEIEVYLRQIAEGKPAGIVDRSVETPHELFALFVGQGPLSGNYLHEGGFSSAVSSNDRDSVVVVDNERSIAHEHLSSGKLVALYFDVQMPHGGDDISDSGFCNLRSLAMGIYSPFRFFFHMTKAKRQSGIIIKTPEQIEGIRRSSKLAAATLDMIAGYVKPGITTEELDNVCNAFILKNGGVSACIGYNGYPKFTCISIGDVVCHGIPNGKTVLKDGDIVNVDVTTIVDGYFGDTSRTYLVGNVSSAAKKLVETAKKCLDVGISEVRPGNRFGNIGYAIANYAEKLGYGVVREYTGHGTGIRFHEEPYVVHKAPKDSGAKMEPGMIFTIEPMINMGTHKTKLLSDGWTVKTQDGKLSAQFEHTVLVTEDGCEILTVV